MAGPTNQYRARCGECGRPWTTRRRYFAQLIPEAGSRSTDRLLCQDCLKEEEIRIPNWVGADEEGTPYLVFLCRCGRARRRGVEFVGPEDT